jgi:AmiR/NasT family two-component response regulator
MAGNRDIIGQAKGILMARAGISDDEAFDLLRKASQRLNIELAVVAEQVATGTTVPEVSDPAAN